MDDELLSDDLMPNEGSAFYPEVDEDLQQEENREKAMIQAAEPLMDDLLLWFQNQIDETDSVSKIDLTSKVSVEAQIQAQQIVKNKLMVMKVSLEILRTKHSKN